MAKTGEIEMDVVREIIHEERMTNPIGGFGGIGSILLTILIYNRLMHKVFR